ncbi:hypothetical protein DY000_02009870 [Brassica cretica]|uniref:Replication factor A C-terminal domain-containing protein n=1 Tax=Brassica cretica TaxID=69181 RepID=A0ABQ7CH26_BRACR|nr:hypothetical protein DY000_02009870 [Brassica cretica]
MATNFDKVMDLSPAKTTWKIKVKIIHLWRQYSAGDIDSIEMVLIDSNGDTIQATVNEDVVPIFESFLEEDGTLSPEYLIDIMGQIVEISFLETTRVRSCESSIEVSGFDPTYRDILDGSLNSDYLVDVIGQIVEVSPIEVVTVNGKDTNKISLELRNSNDERLQTVLWGVFATDVMEAIQMRRNHAIICVIRFGKINVWKGKFISNAYNVSDVSLNPPMVEVDDFIAVLPKDELVLPIVDPKPLSVGCGVSQKDDFFVHTPRKTISQLSDARHVEKCIVMCTIAAIDSDMGWYYLSCKVCAKKVLNVPNDFDEDGNDDDPIMFTYYCPKCKVSNPKLLPRYKLHLIVLDSTGNSKFLLFDNLALQLLHQPCTELVGPNGDEIEEPAAIPLALNNLIGKTYLFKVGIERENYLYKHDTCIISKIITNHDIITEFQTIVYPKKPSVTYTCDNSILSDAPEGSVMVSDESSQECEPTDLTPAKRRGTLFDNLEAAVDQNSLTRKIQPVNGSNFLCCANFRGIKRGLYHPMYCVDLCGALVRVGDLIAIATKLAQPANIYNSILYSLEFSLINLGYTHIQCVAYGALAHRLNAFWRGNTADVVVTVLRLWRIDWGEGGFNYVTNMEGGSDILFDSNIPEIQFFKSQIPSIDF